MANLSTLLIASDHAGFALKAHLIASRPDWPWRDRGPASDARVDYPDYADLVTTELLRAPSGLAGVLICGSGQGMAIRANRHRGVRAAICFTPEMAALARAHNDANILCLGARFIEPQTAVAVLDAFLASSFEGGRHAGRVAKLDLPG